MTSGEYPPLESATQVVAAFFAALREARWKDAVALVDVEAQAEFHRAEVADLLAQAQSRADFRDMSEGGTTGVAYSPDSATNTALLGEFGEMAVLGIEGVNTIADYASLSPAELLARHLEARQGPVYRVAPSILARMKRQVESQPEVDLDAFLLRYGRAMRRQVIGEVLETFGTDRIAHVVYRGKWSEAVRVEVSERTDPFAVEVLHLRYRSGWRVALSRHHTLLFGQPWFELDDDWKFGLRSHQAG